jgi:hypothetical protein
MDVAKMKILESIGCIVGTTQEYLRLTESETEFFRKLSQKCQSLERTMFQPEQSQEPTQTPESVYAGPY